MLLKALVLGWRADTRFKGLGFLPREHDAAQGIDPR